MPEPPLGTKYDGQKTRWSLVPWVEMQEVADVLTAGSQKYSDNNWQHVVPQPDRYYSAGMRHLIAWYSGEKKG